MEIEGDVLTFCLIYEDHESILQLSEYDTVKTLKSKVQKLLGISTQNQIIEGWKNTPDGDDSILQICADTRQNNITCLDIKEKKDSLNGIENTSVIYNSDEELEVEASYSFVNKMLNKKIHFSVIFNSCTLENALINTCHAPLEQKKILLLYLHNDDDSFSSIFLENINRCEVTSVLGRNFFLLGWDITEIKYQNTLMKALNKCPELSNLTNLVKFKTAAALLIVGINDSVAVFSVMKGNVSNKDFLEALIQTEKFYIDENEEEIAIEQVNQSTKSESDLDSVKFQSLMADMLGDRDYDSFEFDQHEHLKSKIAFALMGPPQEEKGYEKQILLNVDGLYKTILKNSKKIAEYKDRIEISFIYNCTEPLPTEKLSRSKKYKDYNSNTDIKPLPIFVLRKCHGSQNPCRIFVDDIGRTYETWQEYITRNKLHKCQMHLPLNGRYEVDSNGQVLLEKHLSPACSINSKVLQGIDIVSGAGGIVSGGVLAVGSLSSVVIAPAVIVTAGIGCVGLVIYSLGRSAYTLYDRSRHKESLSFLNSEARGAYLNIVAGSLGFVGAGATMAVSQLASRGVNIGRGAAAVVNSISFANIGVSGASLLNSGYDVFDQWYNENQSPSLLTIVQLSSSVLFFGNAVYNFKTCSTIVEETQARTLRDYQESLRSNRHRKTFTKLLKETIRQNNGNEVKGKAEVISVIRNIQNKDEVFAVLTRSNKNLNKNGIKFSAANGEINLNGIQIDMNEFMSMNNKDSKTFLLNLSKSEPTPVETMSMRKLISNSLRNISVPDVETFTNYILKLLNFCNGDIKAKIINILADILANLTLPIIRTLDQLFPNVDKFFRLMDMILGYFGTIVDDIENKYQLWLQTRDDKYYMPIFSYLDEAKFDKIKRARKFFEDAVNMYFKYKHCPEVVMKELLTYFHNWLANQVYEYQKRTECNTKRREHSATSPTKKVPCSICGGYYFTYL